MQERKSQQREKKNVRRIIFSTRHASVQHYQPGLVKPVQVSHKCTEITKAATQPEVKSSDQKQPKRRAFPYEFSTQQQTMNMKAFAKVPRPLIYEIARYHPTCLFIIKCVTSSMKQKVDDVDYLRTLVIEDSNGEFGNDQPISLWINHLRTKAPLAGSWICPRNSMELQGYGCDHRGIKLTLNWDMTYNANSDEEDHFWSRKCFVTDICSGTWELERSELHLSNPNGDLKSVYTVKNFALVPQKKGSILVDEEGKNVFYKHKQDYEFDKQAFIEEL